MARRSSRVEESERSASTSMTGREEKEEEEEDEVDGDELDELDERRWHRQAAEASSVAPNERTGALALASAARAVLAAVETSLRSIAIAVSNGRRRTMESGRERQRARESESLFSMKRRECNRIDCFSFFFVFSSPFLFPRFRCKHGGSGPARRVDGCQVRPARLRLRGRAGAR